MIDLPGLSFDHGEDIAALRDAVRQFAEAEIAPRAAEIAAHEEQCHRMLEEAKQKPSSVRTRRAA